MLLLDGLTLGKGQEILGYALIAIVMAFTLLQALFRPVLALAKLLKSRGLIEWFGEREWYCVFGVVNAYVFWDSMNTVEGWSLIDTLANNWFVCGQVGLMILATNFVALPIRTRWDRGVRDVKDDTRAYPWLWSTGLAVCANLTALFDTVAQRFFPKAASLGIGNTKFVVWTLMDVGAIAFYGAVGYLVFRRRYETLKSSSMSALWLLAAFLVVLIILDHYVAVQ